jgi:hypothetical protein
MTPRIGSDWMRPMIITANPLAIEEELGDRPHTGSTYHQLGMTAQDRRRLDVRWLRAARSPPVRAVRA